MADRKPRSRTAVKDSAVQAAEAPAEDASPPAADRPVEQLNSSTDGGRPAGTPRAAAAKAGVR